MKYFARFFLWINGWKVVGGVVPVPKCIILGVPHTSLWDFIVAWMFYKSVGGNSSIMVNKKFFFWPMNYLLRYMGAVPVDTSHGASAVKQMITEFSKRKNLHLAIAIEGTRKPTVRWKGGFHTIARSADVPVYFGLFDWGHKEVGVAEQFVLSDDLKGDLLKIKAWYKKRGVVGKHPEKFLMGEGLD